MFPASSTILCKTPQPQFIYEVIDHTQRGLYFVVSFVNPPQSMFVDTLLKVTSKSNFSLLTGRAKRKGNERSLKLLVSIWKLLAELSREI